MLLPFTLILAAGETREVAISGNYFELRAAPAIVSFIEFNDRSGGVVSKMADADVTDWVRTQQSFETIRVTNGATAQTLKFYYGDGDSGSNRFTGNVSGTVSLSSVTLAALEYIDLNVPTKDALRTPFESTGSFVAEAALAALGVNVMWTPAQNVNGIIVLSAQISERANGTHASAMLAKAAPPASLTDGEPILVCGATAVISTDVAASAVLATPQYIAPGLGGYYITRTALQGYGIRAARWRAL